MKIKIISVGKSMPAWVTDGYQEYAKRLSSIKLDLIEIPLLKRTKNSDIPRLITQESKNMLSNIKPSDHVIALDVLGKHFSTEEFAKQLNQWQFSGNDVVLLIGGPEGLHPDCLSRAQEKISLSKLTLPHPLVRVMLAEQLYRAVTILTGHPYHRG